MKNQSPSIYTRFWNLLRPDRDEIRNVYIFALLSGILSLGLPLGIQMIINFIQLGQMSASWFVLVCLVVVAIGFSGILNIYQLRITELLQQRIFTRTAFEFSERFPKINSLELANRYAPDLSNRFFDFVSIQKGISKLLIDFTAATLQIIFGLLILSFYHSFFIFIGLLLLVLLLTIIKITGKRGIQTSLEESNYKYKVAHWIQEIARTRVSFKMGGNDKLHLNQTNSYVNLYLNARDNHFKILVQQYGFLIAFKVIIALTILIVGGLLVINEQMNIGQFVAAEIIILLVLSSVEKLILSVEVVYDVLTSIEKIGQVTDLPLEDFNNEYFTENKTGKMDVNFKHVSFAKEGMHYKLLDSFSLHIKPHEKLCIVSDSSVSSNVFFGLLTLMYKVNEGTISIDGIPMNNLNASSLRQRIGTVIKQDKLIFASIYDNIDFGRNTPLNEIVSLCEQFKLTEFIESCEDKYETILNPEGHFIPADVYFKLLLIRSLISKPTLLLLENPDSGLSHNQQDTIIDGLKSIKSTIIMATHNTHFHALSDRIIQLDHGKITFEGTYESYSKH
jgi:ABC-type bacteriocin/lantibiotic exporter with double-glycine peptidase domain